MAIEFNKSVYFCKGNTTYKTRAITSKDDLPTEHYLCFYKDRTYYVPLLNEAMYVPETDELPVKVIDDSGSMYNVAVITPEVTLGWTNLMFMGNARIIFGIRLNTPVASATECYVRANLGGQYAERYVTIAAGDTEASANFSGGTALSTEFTVIVDGCDEIVIPSPGSSGQIERTLS